MVSFGHKTSRALSHGYLRTDIKSTDEPWLLIYDNLDDVQMLRAFWPTGGRGHIIVTSRNPFAASFRACGKIQVCGLSLEDSMNLFYNEVGRPEVNQHNEHIEELLQSWMGVPLAINQMGSFINRVGMDLERFVKLYSMSAARLFQKANLYEEYPHSVATAFATQQLEYDAKAILQAFCFFDPDRISSELIQSSFDVGAGFNSIRWEIE